MFSLSRSLSHSHTHARTHSCTHTRTHPRSRTHACAERTPGAVKSAPRTVFSPNLCSGAQILLHAGIKKIIILYFLCTKSFLFSLNWATKYTNKWGKEQINEEKMWNAERTDRQGRWEGGMSIDKESSGPDSRTPDRQTDRRDPQPWERGYEIEE